jgi:3-oxoacyl-[acyl-carrier protein] reductase
MLVNNAGVYKFVPLEETTEDEFHREFNINVFGTILATKEALKHFGPNGDSVINMSSIASAGVAEAAVYSETKGGRCNNWRAPHGVGSAKNPVNAIAPGTVESEGMHSGGIIGSDFDFEKTILASTPLGRIGPGLPSAARVEYAAQNTKV